MALLRQQLADKVRDLDEALQEARLAKGQQALKKQYAGMGGTGDNIGGTAGGRGGSAAASAGDADGRGASGLYSPGRKFDRAREAAETMGSDPLAVAPELPRVQLAPRDGGKQARGWAATVAACAGLRRRRPNA